MSTSPRMSVVFTKPQIAWLRREAERLGITVGELIRRLIDRAREPAGAAGGVGEQKSEEFVR